MDDGEVNQGKKIFASESNELIWRGLYKDEIRKSAIISEEKIRKAVKEVLKQFPPRE